MSPAGSETEDVHDLQDTLFSGIGSDVRGEAEHRCIQKRVLDRILSADEVLLGYESHFIEHAAVLLVHVASVEDDLGLGLLVACHGIE